VGAKKMQKGRGSERGEGRYAQRNAGGKERC